MFVVDVARFLSRLQRFNYAGKRIYDILAAAEKPTSSRSPSTENEPDEKLKKQVYQLPACINNIIDESIFSPKVIKNISLLSKALDEIEKNKRIETGEKFNHQQTFAEIFNPLSERYKDIFIKIHKYKNINEFYKSIPEHGKLKQFENNLQIFLKIQKDNEDCKYCIKFTDENDEYSKKVFNSVFLAEGIRLSFKECCDIFKIIDAHKSTLKNNSPLLLGLEYWNQVQAVHEIQTKAEEGQASKLMETINRIQGKIGHGGIK